eukprot:g9053.t1
MLRNKYTNLRTLIIHTNRLVSVAGFEELRSLVRLDVSSNNFKNYELPQKFTFMRKLKYLHVRENGLKRLPNDMNSMVYLQFIDARYNELSKLPTNIDKLKTLKSLYLAGNKICSDMTEEQIISTYKLSMNTNTLNLCAKQCATSCLDKYLNDEVCDDPSVASLTVAAASASGVKKREDWCLNKPINGKFVLAEDCGVHKISGECNVNSDFHETAICVFNTNSLEIVGSRKANGVLPLIYRQDLSLPYRLFTVHGGAELTVKNLILSGGDLTGLKGDPGSGGAMFLYHASVVLYNIIVKNNIASSKGGGAAYVSEESRLKVQNTLVYNNSASDSDGVEGGGFGGALFCDGLGTRCILNTSSQLLGNHADSFGGALYCGRGTECKFLAESSISQNVAATGDNGLHCAGGSTCITDGTAFINSPWCLPGTKGSLHGTRMTDDNKVQQPANSGVCKNCLPGTFSDTRNADTCKTCPEGTRSILKAVVCQGIPAPQPKEMSNEELLWRLVLYSVGIVVGLFLMYKTCVFLTLKYTGRLNPDMPLWKAYIFTILYGNSSDDHVLPDGQRRRMDVAMKATSFNSKKKSLLKNEDEGETLLESNSFDEMESGGIDETKENEPSGGEQEYTQL